MILARVTRVILIYFILFVQKKKKIEKKNGVSSILLKLYLVNKTNECVVNQKDVPQKR